MHDKIMLFFHYLIALWQTAFHCHLQSLQTSEKGHGIYLWGFLPSFCLCLLEQCEGSALLSSHLQKGPSTGTLLQTKTPFFTWHILYHPLQMWDRHIEHEVHNVSSRVLVLWLPGQLGLGCYLSEKEEFQSCTTARIHPEFWPHTPNGFHWMTHFS